MSAPTTSVAFSSSTPAAPTGQQDIVIQSDGGTPQQIVSGYDRVMVGDSGSGGLAGNVPQPPAGSAAAGKVLRADGTWVARTGVLGITIDGGGSTPSTGLKGFVQIPFACTITGWSLIADQSGSASIDVWFLAGSAPPSAPSIPTSASKISASAPAALASTQAASGGSSAVSTWSTTLSQWGTLAFNLTAASTVNRITLELQITKQ